jgi:DNA-binding PadR family transcriptional regulator
MRTGIVRNAVEVQAVKLEHIILGLLSLKPHTGYDIKKYLDTEGPFFREPVHFSQLYRTLKSMEQEGWVSFVEESREGRPDAKVYHITPVGRDLFLGWLRSPLKPSFRYQESELLFRLAFGSVLDNATILRLLHNELELRQEQISRRRGRDRTIQGLEANDGIDPARVRYLMDLAHEAGSGGMDHYVSWLQRTIDRVERELPDTNTTGQER